jgi:hypothetical protein
MGYRWKPTKAQKDEYKAKMKVRNSLPIINATKPIRTNCYVEFYSINQGDLIRGKVIRHSYGANKNQHTFSIQKLDGSLLLVKGRNLYPNLLKHIPGQESLTTQMQLFK